MSNPPPHIDLTKQKPGTQILVETEGSIWGFELVSPSLGVVKVESSDERFRDQKNALVGQLVESSEPYPGLRKLPHGIVKGWPFQLKFQNVDVISFAVKSAQIGGDGWQYEAIK